MIDRYFFQDIHTFKLQEFWYEFNIKKKKKSIFPLICQKKEQRKIINQGIPKPLLMKMLSISKFCHVLMFHSKTHFNYMKRHHHNGH